MSPLPPDPVVDRVLDAIIRAGAAAGAGARAGLGAEGADGAGAGGAAGSLEEPGPGWGPFPFEELALEAFAFQYRHNPVYARFCDARGATPETLGRWEDVPPVPTRAFKELPLVVGDPGEAQAVFRTSGTTHGEKRGVHRVQDLRLYDASALPNFQRFLVPEGERIPFLSLIPGRARQPDSSLSYMVERVHASLGEGPLRIFADPDAGVDAPGFARALDHASEEGEPVLVLGTAFSFVHWLDSAEGRSKAFDLPPGSRVMETGGFKGRSRALDRADLYRAVAASLGVGVERIVNEYGMTEMCSQFYEPVLVEGGRARSLPDRRHVPPPWVRSRVLDPVTLSPVPDGETGILSHFDLANLGSVCHLLTEDLGVWRGDGFRVLGRSPGAEPRGCSLTMEELMESQDGRNIRE